MNGIVEVIISLSEYSEIEVPRLCHEIDCNVPSGKNLNCFNCPLCSTKFMKPNVKLYYGDKND